MIKKTKKLQILLILVLILKILGMIYRIFSTRLLGLDGNRLVALIMPSLSLALATSSLSIASVVNQEISINFKTKALRARSIMLSAFKLVILSTSIVSLLILASFPLYKYIYQDSFIYYPMLLTIPLLYFSNTSGIMKGYLESNNNFIETYLSNIIESTFKLITTIVLLIIFKNFSAEIRVLIVFLCLMLSEASSCIYLAKKIKKHGKITINNNYQKCEKKLISHAIPLTLDSLITTIFSYIIPFIFYYFASKNGLDFYTSTTEYAKAVSYAIPLLLLGEYTTYTLAKLTFPSITKIRDDKANLNTLINNILSLIITISSVIIGMCYFHGDFILTLLYGNSCTKDMVRLLSPLYFLIYFNPIFMVILQAYNKEKKLLLITIIAQIISVCLVILFTYLCKENGYIIGISLGIFIKSIMLLIVSLKELSFKPQSTIISHASISILYFFLNSITNNYIFFILSSLTYVLAGLIVFFYRYKNKKIGL